MRDHFHSILKIAMLFTLILSPAFVFAQVEIETKEVKFEKGSSGTTITDQIKGDRIIDYILNAEKGQTLKVKFKSSNTACYFNLMAPGEEYEAYYNSSMNENTFSGTLEASGDQRIRVYLMRSAARRNETADYNIEISITSD